MKIHGQAGDGKWTRTYTAWMNMKNRCAQPKATKFHLYGGRGIRVCDRWRDSFEAFFADMGPCPEGLTLERRSSSRDYQPDNCRWATRVEQANNTSQTLMLTINGETLPFCYWMRRLNVSSEKLVRKRIRERGWPVWRAMGLPPDTQAHLTKGAR